MAVWRILLCCWLALTPAGAPRAEHPADRAAPHRPTTEELLNSIIPRVEVEAESNLWRDYKPQLGDVILRQSHWEMSPWFKWFFGEDYTHSGIITQVEPEVKITHCTKEKYISGPHESLFHFWALEAIKIQVLRLKDPDPAVIAKILAECKTLCAEGIQFDHSWDYTKGLPEYKTAERARKMYCTVMVWQAFKQAGVDIIPELFQETSPIRKSILYLAGCRVPDSRYVMIRQVRTSEALTQIAEFEVQPVTVAENIRLESNIPDDIRDIVSPSPLELVEQPDPRVLVPTYKGSVQTLRRNPLFGVLHPEADPTTTTFSMTIRQTLRDIGEPDGD